jgi:hypothetical protein
MSTVARAGDGAPLQHPDFNVEVSVGRYCQLSYCEPPMWQHLGINSMVWIHKEDGTVSERQRLIHSPFRECDPYAR